MSESISEDKEFLDTAKMKSSAWTYGIVIFVFAVIIGGLLLISRFNEEDYNRDVENWRERLNLIVESRKSEINSFISGNFDELRSLSDNSSLKLYLTELQMTPQELRENEGGEIAQKSYLRNLLMFTAQRAGFMDANSLGAIPANIPSENKSGLLVLDNNNKLIVGTPMVNGSVERILVNAKEQKAGEEKFFDMQQDADGVLYIGFSVPIYSIQGEKNSDGQIGKIVAIKTIGENLFSLLKQPGAAERTLENLLVRVNDKQEMEYLTPMQDGCNPICKSDKASAIELLGTESDIFVYDRKDYRGQNVLAMSRPIETTGWKLISKIDTDEAFAESGAHRSALVKIFTLVMVLIVMAAITLWWYAYSRHALMASSYFKQAAQRAKTQENLLRLVTDHQPEEIYIVDNNQTYRFANKKVAELAGMSQDSVMGKTIADVRGAVRAQRVKEQCEVSRGAGQPVYTVHHEDSNGADTVIRSGYIPVSEIPMLDLPQKTEGVLVVEQDISEVYHERERRLNTQRELVKTLLGLVDKRDPFSANHSLLVSHLAHNTALEMKLDKVMVDTTVTAASLMNVGKIIVPSSLLTKSGQLNDKEKDTIRNSLESTATLLEKIEFEGPVVQTLKQWQEKWDGSGSAGLKGDAILVSARIISAANAFIGMISPRSWRNAMTIEAASKFMLDNSGTYFDKRVVIALLHYVENENGKEWIYKVLKSKTEVA